MLFIWVLLAAFKNHILASIYPIRNQNSGHLLLGNIAKDFGLESFTRWKCPWSNALVENLLYQMRQNFFVTSILIEVFFNCTLQATLQETIRS